MSERIVAMMMKSGEVVIGIETTVSSGEGDNPDIRLSYPVHINVVTVQGQGPDGQPQPQQQMQIGPYFAIAEYNHKEGLLFHGDMYLFCEPAVANVAQAHTSYVNQIRVADNGLVTASALPENQFGIDPSEMTGGGGLRISE